MGERERAKDGREGMKIGVKEKEERNMHGEGRGTRCEIQFQLIKWKYA